ncbi:lamin tail domain-containing protein [Streptomyces sp. F001]|uniref:lamin tail domain-containing protein n=1 Tax=Streptomyces sp. F001 TaxID=1510026 RepID=UPI001F10D46D|nr:lamin tail domain-containing protein [Streptomyces sp. F001]
MSSSVATARRLSAAALTAAAVLGATALPASGAGYPRPDRAQAEISAVQYDSPGYDDGSNRSLNREWVEITNNSRRDVDLDGWTLKSEDGDTYTFDRYRLEGRSTVRIHTGFGRDTDSDLYQDSRDYVWGNRSDTATLRNDRGRFIDDHAWGHDRDRHHHDRDRHHHGGNHHRQ